MYLIAAAALRKKGVTRSNNNELIHSLSSHLTIELISDSSQMLAIYVSHSATDKYVLHCIILVHRDMRCDAMHGDIWILLDNW